MIERFVGINILNLKCQCNYRYVCATLITSAVILGSLERTPWQWNSNYTASRHMSLVQIVLPSVLESKIENRVHNARSLSKQILS